MDQLYDYRNKYSGKIVTDVSMKALGQLLEKLKRDNWNRGKFGLGCVQWTGERTYTLYKKYAAACGYQDSITLDQATKAEGNMIIEELSGKYSDIYNQWNSGNSNKNSGSAAYDAGYRICKKYEVPADTENQAKKRGKTAQNMYEIMTS
jgi:ribosomal protein L37E